MDRPDVCLRLAELLLLFLDGSKLKTTAILPDLLDEAKILFEEYGCHWSERLIELRALLNNRDIALSTRDEIVTEYRFELEELYGQFIVGLDPGACETGGFEDLKLNGREKAILCAVGEGKLTSKQISAKLGKFPDNGTFRGTLSQLVKRGILDNCRPGYIVQDQFMGLIKQLRGASG